jgi:hypothetical protein
MRAAILIAGAAALLVGCNGEAVSIVGSGAVDLTGTWVSTGTAGQLSDFELTLVEDDDNSVTGDWDATVDAGDAGVFPTGGDLTGSNTANAVTLSLEGAGVFQGSATRNGMSGTLTLSNTNRFTLHLHARRLGIDRIRCGRCGGDRLTRGRWGPVREGGLRAVGAAVSTALDGSPP